MEEELKNFKLKKIEMSAEVTSTNSKLTATTTSNSCCGTFNNMMEEMKKVQLKKVEKVEITARPKINSDERDFISNALSEAINQRRKQIIKNDNSETSDCEWSD